jgi:small subunit ribosomal protein S9
LIFMTEEKKAPAAPARKKTVAPKAKKAEEKHVEAKEHKKAEAVHEAKHETKHEAPAAHEAKHEAHKEAKHAAPEAKTHEQAKAHEAPKAPEAKSHEAPKAHDTAKSKKKKAPKKEARKVFVVRGKRKESIARATISAGKGVIRLNSQNVSSINNHYVRDIIVEPLRYVGPEANNVDISITVRGGGVMGQAQAARTAIANALAMFFEGMNLRQKFLAIDKSLIIEDTRRVETKKFRGPKARARFQKSYR